MSSAEIAARSASKQILNQLLRRFCKTIKSQISSTKLQINLKFKYSMTKTSATVVSNRFANPVSRDDSDGPTVDGSFVWVFEFGSLRFACDLVFGAWNFHDFH